MKMEGKADATLAWARQWPGFDGYLKLNAILTKEDDASMSTVFSDAKGEPFIDGTARHEFIFGLRMMLPWSDGTDKVNSDAERLMEQWRDWVSEQYPENIPDWPGAAIDGIEALYDVPSVTVYQEDALAVYNFQAKIIYTE